MLKIKRPEEKVSRPVSIKRPVVKIKKAKKGKKKNKIDYSITCRYCKHFHEIQNGNGGIDRCPKTGRRVYKEAPICDDFSLFPFFFCEKNGQQYDIVVCLARQEKNICSRKCIQGKTIKRYCETLNQE